nr:hypothetical protein [Campylobacter sp.]
MNYIEKYKIMKEFDYSKENNYLGVKTFLDSPNSIILYIKKNSKVICDKINFSYCNMQNTLIHTICDKKSSAVFINENLAKEKGYKLDYLSKFGLYAILLGFDLHILHDFNKIDINPKIFDKLDDLAKNMFVDIEDFLLPNYTKDELALFLFRHGRKFVCVIFNAIYDNKITFEFASSIFGIDKNTLIKFYDDFITLAYIHRQENGINI